MGFSALILVCILNITLGLFILLRDPRAPLMRSFFAISILISAWAVSNYLTEYAPHITINRFFNSLAYLFGLYAIGATAIFSYIFSHQVKQFHLGVKTTLLCVIFLIIGTLSLTPYIAGTVSTSNEKLVFTTGPLIAVYLLFITFLIISMLRNFYSAIRNGDTRTKAQGRIIAASLIVSVIIGTILNAVIPALLSNYETTKYGPVLLSLFLISTVSYAIARHRLFDIRFFVVRSLAYVLTLVSIGFIYGFLAFSIVGQIFFRDQATSTAQQIVDTLLAIALVFTFQPIQRFFNRITNRLFYRDAYDSQVFITQLNQVLVSSIDIDAILKKTSQIMESNLKSEFCIFKINPTETTNIHIVGGQNNSNSNTLNNINAACFKGDSNFIIADDLEESDPLHRELRLHNYAIVARLADQQGLHKSDIGYVILGDKQSGKPYNNQDLRVIGIVVNELSIAIQNALHFEEIQRFNSTLQAKVDEATRQLRKTNEKLKAMDEAKDEFISMASHQLRTPLTSVKGYVSMVLDGDAGRISAKQRQLLDQAFSSSQRMVYLIADLLNVSRLRTGKFVIENKPTQLVDVISAELEQLDRAARVKNLRLSFEKPKSLPMLMLDETKIRQVIMNFIDNALYYTPAGGNIVVKLVDNAKSVEFTVTDNGLGVPRAEQHNLFTKFYRAGNARKARPDGTGLGLFMAKKIIIAQGGAIVFSSLEGKGSTFGFTMPKSKLEVVPSQAKHKT